MNNDNIDRFTIYKHKLDDLITELTIARDRIGSELNSDNPCLSIMNSSIMHVDISFYEFRAKPVTNKGNKYHDNI